MLQNTFHFGTNKITGDTFFTKEKGYGFVTHSDQALYTGGWNLPQDMSPATTTPTGVELTDERDVAVFKALVEQDGAYRVHIETIAGEGGIANMSLFCGRRNLIQRDIHLEPGSIYHTDFVTYVAPYIPAMMSTPSTERAIYISITGAHAALSAVTITPTSCPTLFIAGDSTLTDQNAPAPYYPYGSCGGWAQMLSQYFRTLPVCNQAHSGMTTNCFRDDGHLDIVLSHLKKKDIVMLQFGHNDQKRRNLAAFGGYLNNLRWYVGKIREYGAYPILLSPISRIPILDNGRYRSLLATHAQACRMAAEECDVPLIDLHELTFEHWVALGEARVHDYFMQGDITHTNDFGASLIASMVVSELQKQRIYPLCELLRTDIPAPFLPDRDTHELPPRAAIGNPFDIPLPYADIDGIPQYSDIEKALKNGLLDPCVLHLHPTAPMPRAQFLMVYFKALRLSGKRPYLGTYVDMSRWEWDSAYVQACIDEHLIDETTTPDARFRPDDDLTMGEFASFLIRGMKSPAERNINMVDCYSQSIDHHFLPEQNESSAPISRADCYAGLVRLMETLNNAATALPSDTELHPLG